MPFTCFIIYTPPHFQIGESRNAFFQWALTHHPPDPSPSTDGGGKRRREERACASGVPHRAVLPSPSLSLDIIKKWEVPRSYNVSFRSTGHSFPRSRAPRPAPGPEGGGLSARRRRRPRRMRIAESHPAEGPLRFHPFLNCTCIIYPNLVILQHF